MVGRELSGQYFPPKTPPASSAGGATTRPRPPPTPSTAVLKVEGCSSPARPAGVSFTARARRDPRLRRPGRLGAHRADGDDLRRHARPLAGTIDARGAARSRRARRATPSGAASTWRPRIASATAWCCRCRSPRTPRCPTSASYNRWGWLDRATERRVADAEVTRLRTKTPSIRQKVVNLSGGNQQKVVLGKVAGDEPQGADPRRADARHRRRRQGRDLPPHGGAGRRRGSRS